MEAWEIWAEQLQAYLDCPCQVIAPRHEGAALQDKYEQARERGRREGFTPVWIVVSDVLLDALWDAVGCAGEQAAVLRQELEADGADWEADFLGQWEEAGGGLEEAPGIIYAQLPLLLAEIPTDQPWQIPAWLPLGGVNECPDNEALLAVARYWQERYGAVIVAVSYDSLTFLARPVVEIERAEELALEQFAFNYERVETIRALAANLRVSAVWDFWWDQRL